MSTATSQNYSESGFWAKIKQFAASAGYEVVEKALWLYYAAQERDTPLWAKTIIFGALAYFISPVDGIPDIVPVVGYTDDLSVIGAAIVTTAMYIPLFYQSWKTFALIKSCIPFRVSIQEISN